MGDEPSSSANTNEVPLSLGRLREAFAAMLGERDDVQRVSSEERAAESTAYGALSTQQAEHLAPRTSQQRSVGSAHHGDSRHGGQCPPYRCEVNPRSVVEAILFVGRPDNGAISARELAAAMRGVSPGEVEAAVRQLNALYDSDQAPYHIEGSASGYRLVLRDEFVRMRDKFYGRGREARLSPAAIEVLSIIAYNQPITAPEINDLRGAANGAALATLVRRRLVRLERPDGGSPPRYTTTERFLKLFGLESLGALPRSEDLEKV
jgi:segregation and condensation protein B